MKEYYVYIMSNYNDNVFYTGITNNLIRRVYEHKNKLVEGFTKKYNINKLLYYEITTDVTSAIEREKKIKKLSRLNKEKLIDKINKERIDLYETLK